MAVWEHLKIERKEKRKILDLINSPISVWIYQTNDTDIVLFKQKSVLQSLNVQTNNTISVSIQRLSHNTASPCRHILDSSLIRRHAASVES